MRKCVRLQLTDTPVRPPSRGSIPSAQEERDDQSPQEHGWPEIDPRECSESLSLRCRIEALALAARYPRRWRDNQGRGVSAATSRAPTLRGERSGSANPPDSTRTP